MDIRTSAASEAPRNMPDKPLKALETALPAKPAAAPAETVAAVQQPGAVPSMAQLEQAFKEINKTLPESSQGLEFSVDADSNRTIVKVVDRQTQEVLRQIPSEEVLEIAKALDQMRQGLLVSHKA